MQNNQLKMNNKGVTLVEVIAVIAVLGVVMAAVTGFMITSARMSAQVSTNATVSSREQAAVEFINRQLWGKSFQELKREKYYLYENELVYELWTCETIDGAESPLRISSSTNDSGESVVTYNGIELCEGKIDFDLDPTTNTVTYFLNDTKHVVHLRTEPNIEASEQ